MSSSVLDFRSVVLVGSILFVGGDNPKFSDEFFWHVILLKIRILEAVACIDRSRV